MIAKWRILKRLRELEERLDQAEPTVTMTEWAVDLPLDVQTMARTVFKEYEFPYGLTEREIYDGYNPYSYI